MTVHALGSRESAVLSLLFAAAVAGATARHLAPGTAAWSGAAIDLALAVVGYAAVRLTDAVGPGKAWAAALGRIAPPVVLVVATMLAAGLLWLPPLDLRDQARTALWTALGLSNLDLLRHGPYAPESSDELLLHLWIVSLAAQLALGWTLAQAALGGRRRLLAGLAGAGLVASLALDLWLSAHGRSQHALFLPPAQAWPFLTGALAAMWLAPAVPPVGEGRRGAVRLAGAGLAFYLWIWPLALAPRMLLARPLSPAEIAAVVAAATLLAVLTEGLVGRRGWVPKMAIPALAAAAAAGAALWLLDGLPARASPAIVAGQIAARTPPPLGAVCNSEGESLPPAAACTRPAGARADVVLWGNSHADQISPVVLAWAGERGLGVRQATRSGCLPLVRADPALADRECLAFNRVALDAWGRTRPRMVVMGAGWTVVLDRDGRGETRLDALSADLTRTLRELRAAVGPGTRIVLLGVSPDFAFDPAGCHARRAHLKLDTARCDRVVAANAALAARVDARLAAIAAREPGVSLFRPWTALCEDALCRTRGAEGPWHRDRLHLSETGGRALTGPLAGALDAALTAD